MEQDHRDVKEVTRPLLGFKVFEAAQPTLVGIERMPMLQKRPWEGSAEQGLPAADPFYALAASPCPR